MNTNELANLIGDYCHTKYMGTHSENGIWHYSYKDEVVNMVNDFFTKTEEGKKISELLTPPLPKSD